jgi:hypothetical protein
MQNQTNRLQWAVILVALRVVGVGIFVVVTLCFAALSFIAFHSTPRAYAASSSFRMITGSISSSPSTGPAGTTIAVSGSGWGGADGTPVSFGYEVYSGCQTVSDAQDSSLSSGSFSGWFRWPSGTALNTFRVCALLGNVMEVAGSFSVLSSSPPSVSISPSTLAPNTQATITASNYYPAGTQVNFSWMSGNTVVDNVNSVVSNTSGIAILTFTVPNFSISSGSYSINASAGGGQPPTLFSSTNFTYHPPVVPPSPTPNPSPTPSPMPSTTTTPGVTPTATAIASTTATTGATPTVGASPTVLSSQTPAPNSTNSGNNGGSNTGTPATDSSGNMLLIGGLAVLLGALLLGLVAALLMSRSRKAARAKALPSAVPNSPGQVRWANPQGVFMNNGAMLPPLNNGLPVNNGLPGSPNAASYPPYNPVSGPDMFSPQANNMPAMSDSPVPVPVGAGTFAANGNAIAPAGNPISPPPMSLPPLPLQPPAWLTNSSSGGIVPGAGGNPNPTIAAPADPALDSMRRQAQAGLFVAPRAFKDERSQ